jgi:hypothetical protein
MTLWNENHNVHIFQFKYAQALILWVLNYLISSTICKYNKIILAWWELKNTQFQEVIFVITIFEHRSVLSPLSSKHSQACHFENSSQGANNWFPKYNKPYICSRTACTFIRSFNTNRFTNLITSIVTLWFIMNTEFHQHVIQTLSKFINLHMVDVVTNIAFLHFFHNKRMLCIKGPLSNNNF